MDATGGAGQHEKPQLGPALDGHSFVAWQVAEQGSQLIVLSAKNDDRLEAYMQSMHAYLEHADVELVDLAYTLQIGRDEMPARLALLLPGHHRSVPGQAESPVAPWYLDVYRCGALMA